jgi:PAS domain S-box-containing protein
MISDKQKNNDVVGGIIEQPKDLAKLFKLILENVIDVFYVLDIQTGQYTFVSPSVQNVFGYSVDEALKLRTQDLLTPESYKLQADALNSELQKPKNSRKKSDILELNMVRKDKTVFFGEVVAKIITDDVGNEVSILGVMRDITDRRNQDMKFKSIFENSLDAIIIADAKTAEIIDSNHTLETLLGYSKEELLKKKTFELHPKEEAEEAGKIFKEYIEEKRKGITRFNLLTKNNEVVTVDANISLINLDNMLVLVGSFRDVTELQREKKILLESEKKFLTIFKYNPICLSLTRYSDGHFLDANDSFLQTTGFNIADLLGKTSLDVNLWVSPNDRVTVIANLTKSGVSAGTETKWRKKNSDIIDVNVSAYIIDINNEKYMLGVVEDITDKKKQLEKLREEQNKYQSILESSSDSIFLLSTNYQNIVANSAMASSLGKTKEEVIGKTIQE